jgi:hypothetical protein
VKHHTARSEPQTAAIADLRVLAIEYYGDVAIRMSMSGQLRIRRPPLP